VQTSCQQLIESGPFRHNSRARVTVERDAADLVRINIIDPKIRTTIVIADSHLRELREMIDTVLALDDERLAALEAEADGLDALAVEGVA
jgi:hypothetical protein